jgi:hypothetical protein
MSDRKAFLLRIDPKLLEAVQRWADDDLRSLNAQIEFLLRRTLRDAGRLKEDPRRTQRNEEYEGTKEHRNEKGR